MLSLDFVQVFRSNLSCGLWLCFLSSVLTHSFM